MMQIDGKALPKEKRKALRNKMLTDAPSYFADYWHSPEIYGVMRRFAESHGAECFTPRNGNPYVQVLGSGTHLEIEKVGSSFVLKKTHGKEVQKVCFLASRPPKWVDPYKGPSKVRGVSAHQLSRMEGRLDWVRSMLRSSKVDFVDKRPDGGALWALGGAELEPMMERLASRGAEFVYAPTGGEATSFMPAWYLEGIPFYQGEKAAQGRKDCKVADEAKPQALSRAWQQALRANEEEAADKAPTPSASPARRSKPSKEKRHATRRSCANCANIGAPKCPNGGFALCGEWAEAKKNPDYWPEMRKGGSGWGSPQKDEDDPFFDRDSRPKKGRVAKAGQAKKGKKSPKRKVSYPVSKTAAQAMTKRLHVGARVTHKKAGAGTVKALDSKTAVVKFSRPYKGKTEVRFPVPIVFEQGVLKMRV